MSISLAGIFPPIPTPFHADGEIDFPALDRNLMRWNEFPLAGYVVGGSNGEFVFLTENERVQVVQAVRELVPANRLLIAGAAAESSRETIEITSRMADAGADLAIVVTPHYFKKQMTAEALEHHYRLVADAAPIPIVLYSVPSNTGIDLPVETVVHLAEHPNIIGLKDSGGDVTKIARMVHATSDRFQILAGSAGFFLGSLAVGAVGAVSALANIAGAELHELAQCFQGGELEAAQAIQLRLVEPNRAVTARFGVPGLKAAMDMMGYDGGPVRSPLLPLGDSERSELRAILEAGGLL